MFSQNVQRHLNLLTTGKNMSIFDGLLNQIKNAVIDRTTNNRQPNNDRDLLGSLGDLLGQNSNKQERQERQPRPASEDPYGDPADQDQGHSNARPASEDPYGDPADRH
jgi:hypothetical protein